MDQVAKVGLGNGAFEDCEEDGGAVVDEFFAATPAPDTDSSASASVQATQQNVSLEQKLDAKAQALASS